jgi:hypothetical protein
MERAAGLLREALAKGPRPVAELVEELGNQHVSRRTLYRVKRDAGVEAELEKTPRGCRAVWRLTNAPAPAANSAKDEGTLLRHLLDDMGPYGDKH